MSTAPRLEFGKRLRQLRDSAGLQAKQVAEAIGISGDLASRYELGQRWPKPEHLRQWALTVGLGNEEADTLVADLAEVRKQDRELRIGTRYTPLAAQQERSRRFVNASRVRTLAVSGIPFYLQTTEYARQEVGVEQGGEEVAVMRQADANTVGTPGKYFEIILAESALRLLPCDRAAMRGQIGRLHGLIGTPNIEFGVIPFGVALATPLKGSFSVFDDITVLETVAGEVVLTPKEAERYSDLVDKLWDEAVRGEEARAILTAATNALMDA